MNWPDRLVGAVVRALPVYAFVVIIAETAARYHWIARLWVLPTTAAVILMWDLKEYSWVRRRPNLRLVHVEAGRAYPRPSPRLIGEARIASFSALGFEVDARFTRDESRNEETRLVNGGRTVGLFPIGPIGHKWAFVFRGEGVTGRVAEMETRLYQNRRRGFRRRNRTLEIRFGDAIYQARRRGFPGLVVTTRKDGSIHSVEGSLFGIDAGASEDEVLLAFALVAIGARIATESPFGHLLFG